MLVEWNENLRQATVHALTPIPAKQEIVTDYMCDIQGCLRSGDQRRTELEHTHHFVCKCPACRLPGRNGGANAADDALRAQAKALKDTIYMEVDIEPEAADEEVEQTRVQQIDRLGRYIDTLKQLELRDFKLAHAYEARAQYHEQGAFVLAEGVDQAPDARGIDPTQYGHLHLASEDWRNALWLQSRIFGEDHPETQRTSQKYTKCHYRLALLEAPTP